MIARFAVLAMIFSLMAVALPASAHSVAIDTTGPCPAATPSAGFTDIGAFDATTQTAINCLFAFGITTGTSATTYSPNDTITRWQMALFLVRQLADHGVAIPAAVDQGYVDIGAHPAATQNAINQITQLGISLGTSSNTFSPDDGVTRWQMALFIYRTGQDVGVTFSSNAAHNEFTDILTLSAEAQTAINALADTEPDPAGHIALGTGTSLFSPNLVLVRWQMALFLTRLLAADDVPAVQGVRVTVTPTAEASVVALGARAYTATFINADGTPYTGFVGIQLVEVSAAGAPVYNDDADNAIIEFADGANADNEVNMFPGTDGKVDFIVRNVGAAETTIPVAWEDLDADNGYETTTNAAPTEPFGLGGSVDFGATPLVESTGVGDPYVGMDVTSVNKPGDSFEANDAAVNCGNGAAAGCLFNYDANDIFQISGGLVLLDAFEAALSTTDVLTITYDPATAGVSTFNITTNNTASSLTVTSPAAAVTVNAATFTITGTGTVGATIRVYADTNNDNLANEPVLDTDVVAADGSWSASVFLIQDDENDFVVTQQPAAGTESAPLDVPTITEQSTAVTFTAVGANGGAATANLLDPTDTITITFSGPVTGVGAGDTIGLLDADGSTATLTCGSDVGCVLAGNVLTVTVTNLVFAVGGTTPGINPLAQIQTVSGFTSANGSAVDVVGSGAGRTFGGF
jgi:hypothetical protein